MLKHILKGDREIAHEIYSLQIFTSNVLNTEFSQFWGLTFILDSAFYKFH